MGSNMNEEILKSCGQHVVIDTFTPIQIKGILFSIREISSNVLFLGIKKPVGICGRYTGHLGQILYIDTNNISFFGVVSTSHEVSAAAGSNVEDTHQDLDYGGDEENTENMDGGSKYEEDGPSER